MALTFPTPPDVPPQTAGGGGGADLSNAAPQDLGTAAAGTSEDAARADHVHDMPTAADIAVDASGFNGNLTTSDDTVQEIAQKLDDLVIPAAGIADPGGANDDFLQRKSGAWTYRTGAQVRADIGVGIPRGGYYYVNGQAGGNFSPTKDRMYLTPWMPGGPLTITKIAAHVVVAGNAGSVIRLGLYACDSTGQPTGSPLVDGGTIVADGGGGVKEVTVSTAVTSQMICMAFVWQVGTVGSGVTAGVSAAGAVLGHLIGGSTAVLAAAAFPASCWYQNGVTGALPAISLSGTLGDFAPRMLVKGS